MSRYILKGLTKKSYSELDPDDIFELGSMIGSEITKSEEPSPVDGKSVFNMPDGEETHIDYLAIEKVQPELQFNVKQ